MFKLTALMPTAMLRAIYNSSLAELIKRGDVASPNYNGFQVKLCTEEQSTEHNGYQVKLYTEQDASFTTTWAVYKGDTLIREGNDEFYSSMGEAESSAFEWIDSQHVSASTARSC